MFSHTIYSKVISWFLLLNGLFGLGTSFVYVWQQGYVYNQYTFVLCSIAFPTLAVLFGYFLLLRSERALAWLAHYLWLSVPEFGVSSFIYSHAHGLKINFSLEMSGLLVGINFIAIIGLVLLQKHRNLTKSSNEDALRAPLS